MCRNIARKQRGFLLPVAIFILVVMSAFALTLWRTTTQTSISISQELLSAQAFYAAESGAQLGAAKLLAGAACEDPMLDGYNFSAPGLSQCTVSIGCDDNTDTELYTLTSTGRCDSGDVFASRTIEVGVNAEVDE